MFIHSLQLSNFRNYEMLSVEFSKGVNLLFGDNAQGKTNILEAIMVAATTKSFRGSKEREMIRLGLEEAHICARMERDTIPHRIDMHLKANQKKGAAIDGVPVKRGADLFGLLHAISFSPNDLSMMKNGPVERRRFLDMELCQMDKLYCSSLANYNKIIQQRNNLLKQLDRDAHLAGTIEVWDDQLVRYGTYIIQARQSFVEELLPIVQEKHRVLSGDTEMLHMVYEPNCEAERLKEQLGRCLQQDIFRKATSVGPHRDDLSLYIDEKNVRLYGSQGQQRTVALALKLAEIELVKRRLRDTPVLLLDDVLSELDRNRQEHLLNELKDVQTIVTCTGMEEFVEHRSSEDKIFFVKNGTVTEYNGV